MLDPQCIAIKPQDIDECPAADRAALQSADLGRTADHGHGALGGAVLGHGRGCPENKQHAGKADQGQGRRHGLVCRRESDRDEPAVTGICDEAQGIAAARGKVAESDGDVTGEGR